MQILNGNQQTGRRWSWQWNKMQVPVHGSVAGPLALAQPPAEHNGVELMSFGTSALTGIPVILEFDFIPGILLEGQQGSGKSVRLGEFIATAVRNHPLVILDPKAAEFSLFNQTRLACQHWGVDFRWVSASNDLYTYGLNPLVTKRWENRTILQRAQFLCEVFNLLYGTDFSKGYYSTANMRVLEEALSRCPHATNFHEVWEVVHRLLMVRGHLPDEWRKAGTHIEGCLHRLRSIPQHNCAAESNVDPEELFRNQSGVLYVHAPSKAGAYSSAELCRMVLHEMTDAAPDGYDSYGSRLYACIDELSSIQSHGPAFFDMFFKWRGMGISFVACCQNTDDLKEGLDEVVVSASSVHERFSIGSAKRIVELEQTSPKTIGTRRSVSFRAPRTIFGSMTYQTAGAVLETTTLTEVEQPLYHRDLLRSISADERLSLLESKKNSRFLQWGNKPQICVRQQYPLSEMDYKILQRTPWSDSPPGTFLPREFGKDKSVNDKKNQGWWERGDFPPPPPPPG